ncbi:hypothetical protein SEA_MORDRED_62 [Arthrobacter phage Mordred]|uniref:Uncharacterized protein n=1 Tax=Arthrobacter phage Mordred TaxID=2601685 RepID=A0A5J6D8H0_9CAUD|nr:hypothetical protein SEA_MORDRED_62 [Arthrobacter phage Mordred]
MTATVQEAVYAYCKPCDVRSEVGITRAEANAWAHAHNLEEHAEEDEKPTCRHCGHTIWQKKPLSEWKHTDGRAKGKTSCDTMGPPFSWAEPA